MKSIYKFNYNIIIGIICLLVSIPGFSQLDRTDPFKGNYMLGNSAEIFVIRAAEDTMEFKVIDAVGNINSGGLIEKPSRFGIGRMGTPGILFAGKYNFW